MSKIASMSIKSFSNDEAYGFALDVLKILEDVLGEVPEFAESFKDSVSAFEQALKPEEANSPSGVEVNRADDLADTAWSNLNTAIHLMLRHPDERVSQAAMQVDAVFSQFENPTHKPYSVEYGIMDRLLSALRALPIQVLVDSQCRDWIDELSVRCDAFNALYMSRNLAQSERVFGLVKQTKDAMTNAYQLLVEDVNYMLRRATSSEIESFAARMNELIARKQTAMKIKKTAKSNASNETP